MKQQWEKINIKLDNGEQAEAITPIIISASRSTDIPAFYADWFFNRLEKGYSKWNNPFNANTPQYISFQNTRAIVFWTKNPKPIMPYLKILDQNKIGYYFQYTINDYEKENLESNVPPLEERIATFVKLSEQIGKDKVIWRFDPILLTKELGINELISRISNIANRLVSYTNKLVFSFADIKDYKKVQRNLIKEHPGLFPDNIEQAELNDMQKKEFATNILSELKIWQKTNNKFKLATCAEAIDLNGIEHNRCIDGELLFELFPKDEKLLEFLGYDQNDLFSSIGDMKMMKDKGQRKACGCIFSKDIGEYNTCRHFCSYCYANSSRNIVEVNSKKIDISAESIL